MKKLWDMKEAVNKGDTVDRTKVDFLKSQLKDALEQHGDRKKECPICLEEIEFAELKITDCGHLFHVQCLEQHLSATHNASCPNCRQPLRSRNHAHDGRDAPIPSVAEVMSDSDSDE